MNYVVLNDNDFYRNINLNNFKEVSVDGRERIDGIFRSITEEILEESSENDGRRDNFLGRNWFYPNSGIIFVVLRIPQNILYNRGGEFLERCFGFFDKKGLYVEMGSIRIKNKKNTFEYFLIGFNKNLPFKIIFDEEFPEKEKKEIIPYVCEKIEKVL